MPHWGFFIHYCSFPSSGTFTLVLLYSLPFHFSFCIPRSLHLSRAQYSLCPRWKPSLYQLSVLNHSSSPLPLQVSVTSLKDHHFISSPLSFCFSLFSPVFLSLSFPVINKSLSFYPRTLISNSSIKPGFFQCTYIPLLSVHSSIQLSSLDFPFFNSLLTLLVLNFPFLSSATPCLYQWTSDNVKRFSSRVLLETKVNV